MTAAQKWIAVIGLAAIAGTLLFAPFEYRGHNSMNAVLGRGPSQMTGTVHAPAWKRPPVSSILSEKWRKANPNSSESDPYFFLNVEEVTLNTGKLGLWWAGIAALAVVAIVVAAPRRQGAQ